MIFFKFEDKGIDFPFYNGIPKLSIVDWVILALAPILMGWIGLSGGQCIPYYDSLPNGTMQISSFLVTIIPFAYVCRGKLGLIFKKPRLKDFKIIIICVILYYVWTGVTVAISRFLGIAMPPNGMAGRALSVLDVTYILTQLMGEDLFKVAVLLIVMGLIIVLQKIGKMLLLLELSHP